ncbi:transposase [Nocardia sp. NPDC056952]|uniref:transposase n=1 Tax=Nocardia sp. NPDC056952 TaxID=3345979 RepID=UPI003628F510
MQGRFRSPIPPDPCWRPTRSRREASTPRTRDRRRTRGEFSVAPGSARIAGQRRGVAARTVAETVQDLRERFLDVDTRCPPKFSPSARGIEQRFCCRRGRHDLVRPVLGLPQLLELHGVGPSSAARLLADTADIHRFCTRDLFASWNGTAPLDASSGDQQRHRLSRAGPRRINRVLHIMAVVQLRNRTAGRVYYDARKAGGKTSMEAMRALKRRLSNVVYTRMLADQRQREMAGPGGHSEATADSSATGSNPNTGQATTRTHPTG